MKKRIMLALCLVLAVTGIYAASSLDDYDLTLNAASNNISFDFDSKGGNMKVNALIEAQFNLNFRGEHGFFTGLTFDAEKTSMGISGGYSYKHMLRNDIDMVVNAGLELGFGFRKGAPGTMALLADLNFNYNLSRLMYLQFGLGFRGEFFSFSADRTEGYFKSELMLPTFGFGFRF